MRDLYARISKFLPTLIVMFMQQESKRLKNVLADIPFGVLQVSRVSHKLAA
jgi:hypothetical protein